MGEHFLPPPPPQDRHSQLSDVRDIQSEAEGLRAISQHSFDCIVPCIAINSQLYIRNNNEKHLLAFIINTNLLYTYTNIWVFVPYKKPKAGLIKCDKMLFRHIRSMLWLLLNLID